MRNSCAKFGKISEKKYEKKKKYFEFGLSYLLIFLNLLNLSCNVRIMCICCRVVFLSFFLFKRNS